MSAARAFARGKPIVAYKAGRFPASAKATVSHTGAMAGEDSVYDAAFERAGIVRVDRIEDVFDTAELLARERRPAGPRPGDRDQRGRPGRHGGRRAARTRRPAGRVGRSHVERLDGGAPASASVRNPVDVLGDAPPERFGPAVGRCWATPAWMPCSPSSPPGDDRSHGAAPRGGRAGRGRRKPLLAAWMGGPSVAEGVRTLEEAGVPAYNYPEQAVRGVHAPRGLRPQPRDAARDAASAPVSFALDRGRVKDADGHDPLGGERGALRGLVEGAARRLRDPSDEAAAGSRAPRTRSRRPSGSATRWCSRSARPT